MTETGRTDRVVTVALLLLGSSQITWAQINPQAIQGLVLVMVLLTSSPDHIILAIAQEEDFGLAWVQEEFWDTSSEARGVSQTQATFGEQTPPLLGPHQQAQAHAQPQDLGAPKGARRRRIWW